ncbi:endonuclease III [Thermosipho melanesiensis]|uniref:Endonuclease III n=2 Tax=Thermosipho melanesiensis TaxID=46541 RepID=A6LK54_THEM4|nr:endonuclease III [Thermosipho melanesiensis]ABR30305.1 endonuclease III [Thermosipho melanesiensis BI429]APT73478.1 endonuclease III [Thermosipho melanesiensis]OOC37427.1 endonuclease III [Thermosipho melanesiensis]OOC39789.1 endonuclease III [Thermosipho melanesiensis]OOC39894.1 endonuclease III [Thermosipho melanesiensis]
MHLEEVAKRIIKNFPRNHKEKDPFKVLITTVLSQRSKDENTEIAANRLFEKYPTPQTLLKAKEEDLYELIKPAGLYRQKAKRIIEISKIIVNKFSGKVPDTLEELLTLPGVGRKTANIVLYVSFSKPALAVDTHVHRISNRLGWCKTKNPNETEFALMKLLPKDLWGPINGSMVKFGKNVCLPRNPKCDICPIYDYCKWEGKK